MFAGKIADKESPLHKFPRTSSLTTVLMALDDSQLQDRGLGSAAASSPMKNAGPPPGLSAAPPSGDEELTMAQLKSLLAASLMNQMSLQVNQFFLQETVRELSRQASSAQPAASSATLQQNRTVPTRVIVEEAPNKGPRYAVSKSLSAKITTEAVSLRREVHRLASGKSQQEKLQSQIDTLAKSQVPPGLKPFKSLNLCEEWQSVVDDEDLEHLIVPAKRDESLGRVAERLHMNFLASNAILNLVVTKRRIARLQVEASETSFITKCLAFARCEKDAIAAASPSTIGEEFWNNLQGDVTSSAGKTHMVEVRRVAAESQIAAERKEKQRIREQSALERASLLSAEDVLKRGLAEIMRKKDKTRKSPPTKGDEQLLDFSKMVELQMIAPTEEMLRAVEKSKNGLTPADGWGQPKKQQQGGKGSKNSGNGGKGYGKDQEKGKSKGKGKPSNKGSGKGASSPKTDGKGGQSKGAALGGKPAKKKSGKGGKPKGS